MGWCTGDMLTALGPLTQGKEVLKTGQKEQDSQLQPVTSLYFPSCGVRCFQVSKDKIKNSTGKK